MLILYLDISHIIWVIYTIIYEPPLYIFGLQEVNVPTRNNYIAMSLALAERVGGSFMSKCRIASLAQHLKLTVKSRGSISNFLEI